MATLVGPDSLRYTESMTTPGLAHVVVDGAEVQPRYTAVVAHGILGSARNWRSFARRVLEQRPRWRFVLVDLRNHGESHGLSGPHDLEACASDLARLEREHLDHPARALLGHSFGGKVVLTYAREEAHAGLSDVWVLDSSPSASPPRHAAEVEAVFASLRAIQMPVMDRRDVQRALLAAGHPPAVAAWMTTNLRRTDAGLVWRFDLTGATEMLAAYRRSNLWSVLESPHRKYRVHVVRGGRSDRWSSDDLSHLARLRSLVNTTVLPQAGHWVHVDAARPLANAVASGLQAIEED